MGTVSELIRTHRTKILRAWTEAARNATSAKDLTFPELASLMPEYLSLLGGELPLGDPRLSQAQHALIERHLSNRLREGFNLNEILTEFAVLGRCVSPFFQGEDDRDTPSVAEVASLYAELYQTSAAVTRIFNEHVLEDEQTMKRYARLLENSFKHPLGYELPPAPLLERLNEVLALILDAMSARTAVLLLFDDSAGHPTTTAGVGSGATELMPMARTLEATTFAGPGGATGTEAGHVNVPAALRSWGVHSLLRVALSADDGEKRVLYVGIEGERPFSASEVRRLEGLGSALTMHLDNAQLRGALRSRVNELQLERDLRERVVSVLVREVRGPLAVAQSSVRSLGSASPAAAAATLEVAETLGRIVHAVDQFLSTTPAVPSTAAR